MIKTTQKWRIGNCLDLLPEIETKSIDLILSDLPYGSTACSWDIIIPFEPLWEQYKRIIKDNGAIVLTASQPFTSALIMSNIKMFKYEWIWNKKHGTNFLTIKKQPLRIHESICVFYKKESVYNPIKTRKSQDTINRQIRGWTESITKKSDHHPTNIYNLNPNDENGYPISILEFSKETNNQFKKNILHPTQKPIALFEYLIRTYTNEGDTVHDSCLGSGTTLEACFNTNRNCIGFEISNEWEPYYIKRLHLDTNKIRSPYHTNNIVEV